MSKHIPKHRIAAVVVLVGAALWVATGRFASVGSDQVRAAQPAPGTGPAAAVNPPAKPAPAPLVTVAAMTPVFKEYRRPIDLTGETRADKSVVLAARSTGVVKTLNITKGQRVGAGEVLMHQEGPEQQAALVNAQMMLAQRERELAADEKLANGGNLPQLRLVAAKSAKAAAEAAVSQARAAIDRLTLGAPFGGIIDKVDVEPGQWATAGMPVATLLSLDPIVVRAEVSERDLGDLSLGAKARITLADGARLNGRLRFISKQAAAITRTYPVEIALPNPGGKIPAGMTASVTLESSPVRAVKVPRSVLTLSADGTLGLRMVDAKDITHFVAVRLVDDTPDGMVVSGVPADMRVIVAGQDMVKDGQKVAVAPPPPGFDPALTGAGK